MNRIDGGDIGMTSEEVQIQKKMSRRVSKLDASWTWRRSPNAKHLVSWQCYCVLSSPRIQRHLSWFLLGESLRQILFIRLSTGLLWNGKATSKALGFNLSEDYVLSLHTKSDNQLWLPHYPMYIRKLPRKNHGLMIRSPTKKQLSDKAALSLNCFLVWWWFRSDVHWFSWFPKSRKPKKWASSKTSLKRRTHRLLEMSTWRISTSGMLSSIWTHKRIGE